MILAVGKPALAALLVFASVYGAHGALGVSLLARRLAAVSPFETMEAAVVVALGALAVVQPKLGRAKTTAWSCRRISLLRFLS